MIDTLLDASADSSARFVRELAGLARGGLLARAQETLGAGAARVSADGLCLAAVWLVTLFLTSGVGMRIRGPQFGFSWDPLSPLSLSLLGVALVLALVGYDRLAAVAALTFLASAVGGAARYDLTNSNRIPLLVPLVCFSALLVMPRRRPRDTRRLLWLLPAAAVAVVAGSTDDPTATVFVLALIAVVPPALLMLRTDPRPAIACGVSAAYFGLRMAQDPGGPGALGVAFLAAAPLVLASVAARSRRLQAHLRL
jgi:hypothetical protein